MTRRLSFRPATESDMHAVVRSFLDSTRADHTSGLVSMTDWLPVMEPQVRKLFARPGSAVVVAFDQEADPARDLIGWLAHETGHPWPYVVYLYVWHDYRRWGMARRLFEAAGVNPMSGFHHATWIPKPLVAKVPRARWDPLTVRFDRRRHERKHEVRPAAGDHGVEGAGPDGGSSVRQQPLATRR